MIHFDFVIKAMTIRHAMLNFNSNSFPLYCLKQSAAPFTFQKQMSVPRNI